MTEGRVVGRATSTICHPSLRGRKLLLVQPLGADGRVSGLPSLAVDPLGAGLGDRVLVTSDGRGARELLGDPKSPVRNSILAIIDGPTAEDAP